MRSKKYKKGELGRKGKNSKQGLASVEVPST